jgi:hypothetical protein
VAQNALQNDSDKELSILSSGEEFNDVIATEKSVQIEAFIQEQLDKFLTICSLNGQLENVILDIALFVVVTLEYFRQSEFGTIPVKCETQISF